MSICQSLLQLLVNFDCFTCFERLPYLSECLPKRYFMIGNSFFFTKSLRFFRYFSNLVSRDERKEVMLNLFVESSKNMMDTYSSSDITRGLSLEIEPGIFLDSCTIYYRHTNMIDHKDKSKVNPHEYIDEKEHSDS